MSYYTDDAVKAKLSSLNDTHDSVVNVAQWLLFHRFVASAFRVPDSPCRSQETLS
jgi:hypothetical protein